MRNWRQIPGVDLNEYYKDNRMWLGRKQAVAHGNRCPCHLDKIEGRVERRRAWDKILEEGIQDYNSEEIL